MLSRIGRIRMEADGSSDPMAKTHEETPSPYAWIADDVWATWNRNAGPADAARAIVRDTVVLPASEAERTRAPVLDARSEAIPPAGGLAQHEEALGRTRGAGRVAGTFWPVCCDRLATLAFHHGAGRSLDSLLDSGRLAESLLDAAAAEASLSTAAARADWAGLLDRIRSGRHSGEGVSLFRCRSCGRVYGAYSEP